MEEIAAREEEEEEEANEEEEEERCWVVYGVRRAAFQNPLNNIYI
tara:strand:- start:514 stop:648 length:135 start_codon:yes stop_codon:yes gene_type:complete